MNDKNAENQYQILEKYCQNITKHAREGKLDPVIGRHEEIRRVIQIFHAEQKIIRYSSVNRALVKLPLLKVSHNALSIMMYLKVLKNKQIYSLDLGLLIAGAKYQGEFEERLKGVLKEIEERRRSRHSIY